MHPALQTAAATGVGSLPHRDADEAAEFLLRFAPELPFAPTLPRRSPAEGMIAQALVGLNGVSVGPNGAITLDVARLDPEAPVATDLGHDAFGGLRAFLRAASGRHGPIKWQFTGPVTLGLTLANAGAPPELAFAVAGHAVRSHVGAAAGGDRRRAAGLSAAGRARRADGRGDVSRWFPLATDDAIDLVSGALAPLEAVGPDAPATGVHCCAAPTGRR